MSNNNNNTIAEWRMKSDKVKKTQFLRELERIKLQKHTIERDRISYMYEKQDKQYTYLEEFEKSLDAELRNERMKINQQLKKIRCKVTEFRRELTHVKPTPEFVENLKVAMEVIESTMSDFKQKQRDIFESLMIAEKETELEISVLEGRINALKEGSGSVKQDANVTKLRIGSSGRGIPKEVEQYEAFLAQHGGIQGGWDDYDHGTFLRIREKYQGKQAFVPVATRQLPGRSEKDVIEHEKWYATLQELNRKKKEVIAIWRKEKMEKEKKIQDEVEDEEAKRYQEEKEKAYQEKLRQEREEKKERLKHWKEKKAKELMLQEEQKFLIETEKQKIEAKKRKEREAARLVAMEQLKAKREDQERFKWISELEMEELQLERQQEIKSRIIEFQNRDQQALSLKQREKQKRQEAEEEKRKRLEKAKMKVNVSRDPSRLYQLTEGWVQRTKDASECGTGNARVLEMPHRAIPSWRQNL